MRVNWWRWRPLSSVGFWTLVALLLRLALWMQPLHQLANDEVEYVTVAHDLLAGRGWAFYEHYHWLRAPLYPLFLAASLWLTRGDLWLAALPTIALSVASVPLAGALARQLAGPQRPHAPALAAACAALLWTLATFASLYMSETLFTALFTSALLLVLRWRHKRQPWLLVLAGLAFGLAILTRSAAMAFLPVLVLWMAFQSMDDGRWAMDWFRHSRFASFVSRLMPPALLLACCLLTIAPWTIRNCMAYGRCILVETGFSYNVWAFNEPREDEATIFRTLEAIANPAERSDYATAQGMERLREDPAILWRKLWPNWTYLWRVNPIIEDRFLLRTYYADPPPIVFLAALLLDDGLMALVAIAGVLGLARAERRAALLGAGWLLCVVGTTLLTHGEGRYRHFLFPVIIPCAALTLLDLWRWFRRKKQEPRLGFPKLFLASNLLALLLAFTIVETYPWSWAWGGMRRSAWLLAGDFAWGLGNLGAAQGAYRNAVAAQERADAWVRLGDAQRAAGDGEAALTSYRAASTLSPAYIVPGLHRGDLLRAEGRLDEARAIFDVPYADPQQVIDWAWSDLKPTPTRELAVGDGLDIGFATGVYPTEEQAGRRVRWTNGRAQVRLAGAAPLVVRLAAPRPQGGQAHVSVCVAEQCVRFAAADSWQTYRLLLPPTDGTQQLVEIRSDSFVGPDGRRLGVLLDELSR